MVYVFAEGEHVLLVVAKFLVWSESLAHQDFTFYQRNFAHAFHSQPQPFDEMIIFNNKSHCCNNTYYRTVLRFC